MREHLTIYIDPMLRSCSSFLEQLVSIPPDVREPFLPFQKQVSPVPHAQLQAEEGLVRWLQQQQENSTLSVHHLPSEEPSVSAPVSTYGGG